MELSDRSRIRERRLREASAALRLPWSGRVCVGLQRLQRGKWMILRIGGHGWRLENRIRAARVGIDPQEQRLGREPAKINDAADDTLRRGQDNRASIHGLQIAVIQFGYLSTS